LLDEAALRSPHEFEQFFELGRRRNIRANSLHSLRRIQARMREQPECFLEIFDTFLYEPTTLEPRAIRAEDAVLALADGGRKWQHILRDDAISAHHGVPAHAAELGNAAERANHRPFAHQ